MSFVICDLENYFHWKLTKLPNFMSIIGNDIISMMLLPDKLLKYDYSIFPNTHSLEL